MDQLEKLVWSEEYRPKTVADCILPDSTRKMINGCISQKVLPNMILYGPAGCGKTTLVKAIAKELHAELLYINASLERNIDMVRNQVMTYSSSVSMLGEAKFVLFDEADGATRQALEALKGVIEQFSQIRFFFTTNNLSRIIEPIRSRCTNIDFRINAEDQAKVSAQFFKRVIHILKEKNVEYEIPAVVALIKKYFPDFRRALNELQRYSMQGKIDSGILVDQKTESIDELLRFMKEKNFTETRKWIAQNSFDSQILLREIYDRASLVLADSCIPQIILILADYMVKSTNSVDQEILLTACMIEIMVQAKWK